MHVDIVRERVWWYADARLRLDLQGNVLSAIAVYTVMSAFISYFCWESLLELVRKS